MRVGLVACLACSTVLGCGDGVGRPIVETNPTASAGGSSSGTGGSSGARDDRDGSGGRGRFPEFGGRAAVWDGSAGRDVPTGDYCASVADWPEAAQTGEALLFELLNFVRESGISCGTGTPGSTAPAVVMKPELRCAARLHARDMAERGFFEHVNPDGIGPEDRIRRTGYSFRVAGESIARGEVPTGGMVPYPAFEELFTSGGGDCENLVDPSFDSVGIGSFDDLWTLDFAGP